MSVRSLVLALAFGVAAALPGPGRTHAQTGCQARVADAPAQPPIAAPEPAPAPIQFTPDQAAELIAVLDHADDQGFAPHAFDVADAGALLASPNPQVRAQASERLKAAALAYARAECSGRIDPAKLPSNWAIRPPPYDGEAALDQALASGSLKAWLQSLPPQDPRYWRLVEVLGRYRQIADRGGWPMLAAGPALKPGTRGERVEALRARLAVEDPSIAPLIAPPQEAKAATEETAGKTEAQPEALYDSALVAAVGRAQARYGLNATGVAGPSLIAALNTPAEWRLAEIKASLERWRWTPRSLPGDRIEINIPAAWLDEYEGGRVQLSMRIIDGRPANPTPSFIDEVELIVFNPPWNVPRTIAAKEIWPKARKRPGYLAREQFIVKPDGSLQQKAGPKSALGRVKFDLPNSFDVYLHDTPARSLFAREARQLSHGCMRLEKPADLAKQLLKDDPNWPAAKIDETMKGGPTLRVPLAKRMPVYVFYWTAFVDGHGQVNFRPDVYGWDEKLLGML